jgi:hypothetical protein
LTTRNIYIILFSLLSLLGFGQNHFTESFENPDSWSGYTTGTVNFDSGDWDFVEVYPENSTNSHEGSKACRINDDEAGASITSPSVNGVGTVSFYYHRPFNGSGSFELQKSVGGGAFTTLATVDFSSVTSPTQYSFDVNDASNNIKVRILNDDNSAHLTIDYISIGTYAVSSGPTISSISHSPTTPTSSQTVSVSADVTDADGVFGVELHWGTSSGSLGTTISMSNTGVIPMQPLLIFLHNPMAPQFIMKFMPWIITRMIILLPSTTIRLPIPPQQLSFMKMISQTAVLHYGQSRVFRAMPTGLVAQENLK